MNMFDGKRLADLRKYHGLGQKELASKLGVDPNTISAYENGLKTPSDKRKIQIAEIFDISLDYLMGLTDEQVSYKRKDAIFVPKGFTQEDISEVKKYMTLMMNAKK